MPVDTDLIDLYDQQWQGVVAIARDLDEGAFAAATECPGWTVKDQLSHLIGIEALFAGEPLPEWDLPEYAHVRNDLGRMNEIAVDVRRARPPGDVIDELAELMPRRIASIRALDDAAWDAVQWTPAGEGDTSRLLNTRLYDWWAHEQDIRRAVDRPGHLAGPIVESVLGTIVGALGFVFGKKAGAAEGESLVIELDVDEARAHAVQVVDGRGRPIASPDEPTVRLSMDVEALTRLALGRWDTQRALEERRVTIDGDEDLAHRVLQGLNITP